MINEKDLEEIRLKLNDLESSIINFQNKHNEQVNSLINLFNDVLETIKNKNNEEEKTLKLNEIKIIDSEFSNKTSKEIADHIINISTVSKNNENEKKEKLTKFNFEDLKMDINYKTNPAKVIKTFKPVEEWIEAFKKTDKYLNVKNNLKYLS